jgi:hypothetical protein
MTQLIRRIFSPFVLGLLGLVLIAPPFQHAKAGAEGALGGQGVAQERIKNGGYKPSDIYVPAGIYSGYVLNLDGTWSATAWTGVGVTDRFQYAAPHLAIKHQRYRQPAASDCRGSARGGC